MTLPSRDEIERSVRQVKGVRAARACIDQGAVSELHVVAAAGSRAKNIARDVRSYLAASLGIVVPHQKISVAVCAEAAPDEPDDLHGSPEDAARHEFLAGERVLFRSVNLLVEGLRCEVHVELTASGRTLNGSATGVPSSLGSERLVAAATLDALRDVLPPAAKLVAGDLIISRVGPGEVVIVEVVLVELRREQRLVGACCIGPDRHRSVVFAVLDAVNRKISHLGPRQWTEFVVAPDGVGGEPGSAP